MMQYQFDSWGVLQEFSPAELKGMDADGAAVIVLSYGTADDGRPYWAYIEVKPSKYKEFMRRSMERKHITFAEYGTFLRYGYDPQVPETIKKEMEIKYGCSDNYRERLNKEVQEAKDEFLRDKEKQDALHISNIIGILKKE
jgi:hypothetical protein